MKLTSIIWQRLYPPNFANEEDNRKAKVLFLLSRACFIGFVTILGIRILGDEYNLIIPLFASLSLLSFSHILLLSKRLEIASYTTVISLFGLCSYLIFISDEGYHDTVLFAVPGLLIIAGILLKKWEFYVFTALTLFLIGVLVALESFGIRTTKFSSLVSPYDGIDIVFIIAITAVSVHILTNNLVKSLKRAKEDEKALQDSEKKHRKLVSNISDVIVIMDKDGIIKYKSPNITKQFGWNPEDLVGKHSLVTAHIDDQDKIRKALIEILKKQDAKIAIEYKYLCKDGNYKPVELTAINMLNDPAINGVLANYKDITERQKANENLQKSEEKFRAAFKTSPNGITLSHLEDGIFVDTNDGFTRLLGYLPEEVIGKSSFDLNIWNDLKDRDLVVSELKKNGIVENLEVEFKSKNGQVINGLMSASILEIEDEKYLLGVTQDITKFKENEKKRLDLESRLQQTQKMESIGTLAGGIAHDFNNILFPILGHSEMLLNDMPKDSRARLSVQGIFKSALRAKELVQQILTFSRQEKNEMHLMKIQPILKEAMKMIRSTIPTTIDIQQDIEPDCAPVKADPTQIHQIIMNLTTNAFHAMEDDGGTMSILFKEKLLGKLDLFSPTLKPGAYACLTVKDTGAGMSQNLTTKIFDPFFTTKEKGKGTGMGLSVVHGIVNRMGGAIQLFSKPGKGTEFNLYFPAEKNTYSDQTIEPQKSTQGGDERILLVDDEEYIVVMVKEMLERLGYQITSRISSIEALEAFQANPDKFDLVITDMAMPKLPGDKFASELIKIRSDIPILLCTGFSETITNENAASIGIKGFLHKPVAIQDLARKIREMLDEKSS